MNYINEYKKWIDSDYFDEGTRNELLSIKDNDKEIEDRFYKNLEFGTAGLRGVVEAGLNRMNLYTVRRTSYGLGRYLLKTYPDAKERGIVIAHDNRNMSREFCMEAAETFANLGIKVYYFDDLRTTPMLSFSVLRLKCVGGIVITASHNPPEYNGYKVYGDNGAQIMPDVCNKVLEEIDSITDISIIPKFDEDNRKNMVLLDKSIDDEFIEAVKDNLIRTDIIKEYAKDFKVVYSPLCGTGKVPVLRVLKESGFENVYIVPEEENPDPNFAGIKTPNPEETVALKRGIDLLIEKDADLLVATDPDSDRVGVAVKNAVGEIVLLTGNQIGGLLTEYVLSGLKEKGRLKENSCLIKTVVTSEFGADIARSMDIDVINILTGFKFIGDYMTKFSIDKSHTFVIGYEESYGYLIGNQCRDKDGVVSVQMISEMALYYRSKGKTLYEALVDLYDRYGYYTESTTSIHLEGKEGSEKIKSIMKHLRENRFEEICGANVIKLEDYLSGVEGFPKSNVLKYYLDDKSWIAFRPSGTEPKIKTYIGTYDKDSSISKEKLENIKSFISEYIKTI